MTDDIVEWLREWSDNCSRFIRDDDTPAEMLGAAANEIARLRNELAEAYDACRCALADSPRWQALAETVVHTYEEARRG